MFIFFFVFQLSISTVHQECITEWLSKHCTCPICRYELPTSNPAYEASRRERMARRKPRYARHELQRMKISELINLCQNKLRIPVIGNGYTKQEVIDLIVSSGKVDIIITPPPMEIKNVSLLRDMGVGKLKRTMKEAGVFFDPKDVIEKEDMVQIFINSGRVVFEEEDVEEKEEEEEEEKQEEETNHEIPLRGYDDEQNKMSYERQDEVKRARLDEEGSRQSVRSGIPYDEDENDENENRRQNMVENVSARSLQEDQQSLNNDAVEMFPSENETSEFGASVQDNNSRTAAPASSTSYSYYESADITTRSVAELRELGRALGVDLTNCLEKREMIEMIVNAMTRSGSGVRFGGGVVS